MRNLKSIMFGTCMGGLLLSACAGNATTEQQTVKECNKMIVENREVIQLDTCINYDKGLTVLQALKVRQSERAYSVEDLNLTELSELLWAANGINRPQSGKRTAPSAVNAQDVDVYVCRADGAYLYDAKTATLQRVCTNDLRAAVAGGQDFVKQAPLSLVLVSDLSRLPGDAERRFAMGMMDAGIVSQNIAVYCAAAGLATVPRASMDVEALRAGLKLFETQIPVLNHPVGYSAER